MLKGVLKMKMVLSLVIGLFISSLLVVGCAPVEETPETSADVIKIAKYYWPGEYWVEIAEENGFFDDAGLKVQIVDSNSDYYESLQDTADGKIDFNNFALFDVVKFNIRGESVVMIVNNDRSNGAEALITKNAISTMSELSGKTIAVSSGYYTEYVLDVVLEQYGLADSVTKVEISAEQIDEHAPTEFLTDRFDGVLTWEPIASEVVQNGGRKLWDTSKIPGISPNGLTVRKSFIDQRPDDVQAVVNVWHRTTEFIKQHPEEAFQTIADNYDVPVGDVQAFTQQDKILDLEDNKVVFSYAAGFESLHGTARQINEFMIEKGITDEQLDSTDFIDARFIRAVE
jgi:NitT/TauT family transport system substrate-binding protein